MKDNEKEIKYLMYLENEKIRLAKKQLKALKYRLNNLQRVKNYKLNRHK